MSEYTYEMAMEFVASRTDIQLDAEIEQAHATMADLSLTDDERGAAMAACYVMCNEKLKRKNK